MVVRVIDPDDASPSGFLLHLMLPDAREPALAHSIVENVLEYFRLKLGLTAVGLQRPVAAVDCCCCCESERIVMPFGLLTGQQHGGYYLLTHP